MCCKFCELITSGHKVMNWKSDSTDFGWVQWRNIQTLHKLQLQCCSAFTVFLCELSFSKTDSHDSKNSKWHDHHRSTAVSEVAWWIVPSSVNRWYTNLFLIPLLTRIDPLSPWTATGVAFGLCYVEKKKRGIFTVKSEINNLSFKLTVNMLLLYNNTEVDRTAT